MFSSFKMRMSNGGAGLDPSLLYAAKGVTQIIKSDGWDTSGLLHTTNDSIVGKSDNYSLAVTITRIAYCPNPYFAVIGAGYHTGMNDNWAAMIQGPNFNQSGLFNIYRLNNYNTLHTDSLLVGETKKYVITSGPTTGKIWRSVGVSVNGTAARDLARLLTLTVAYDNPAYHTVTNAAIWNRILTEDEKNSYFAGTMPIFQ